MSREAKALDLARVLAGTAHNLRADNSISKEAYETLNFTAKFLAQEFTHALAEARREGLMEGAKVVNGLMGKDSGNWNRAIVYAEAAIRAKAQGQLLESTNPSQNSSCASSCESLYDGLRHDDFNADS